MPQQQKVNILLVDDNPNNLIALEAILESLGHNLIRAYSGKEALECVLKDEFALILLDVQMPDMDGFETAVLIKEFEKSRHIPIIFLTAIYQDNNYKTKGYSVGAIDYLTKPIEREALLAKVEAFANLFKQQQEVKQRKEKKEREAELVRQQIINILESIPECFIAFDNEWKCTYINRHAEQILEKEREECISKNIWEVFPKAVRNIFYKKYYRVVSEKKPLEIEVFYEPLDKWIEVRSYPYSDGVSIYFRDITKRKHIEQALRESEERFRIATESAELGTWDYNPITNKLTWSDQCKEMFGVSPDTEINYDVFTTCLHPKDREQTHQAIELALSSDSKGEYKAEYRIVRLQDGIERWVSARGRAFFNEIGQPVRFIGTVLDITNRKRVEEERLRLLALEKKAKEEAEAANRLKDEFLATCSHELRTPLTSILGWVRLLENNNLDEITYRKAVATIVRNAKLQAQIVDDLLDISRMVTGKIKLQVESVDIVSIINSAVESISLAADAKEIIIQVIYDSGIGSFFGDPNRLHQIFWNLLSNAVKFTPRQGRVEVKLEQVASHIEIRVSDTGKGISSEFLPYVFERFRQADSSITRAYGGLGLGLTIVRQLVELHGGSVEAFSRGENKGSTFTVKLPLLGVRLEPGNSESIRLSDMSDTKAEFPQLISLRVLVIDDDLDTLGMLTMILEQCQAEVKATTSAAEALEILERWLPDIIVSDIGMPITDGYELIRQIRRLEPERGGGIPAIALTAYTKEEEKQVALEVGFNSHIPKPIEPVFLINTIAEVAGLSHNKEQQD
jgi:PAS domain S-box-containing protein